MILIQRAADDPSDSAPAPSTGLAVNIPRQADPARPDAINVGIIARKPRAVANALQKLYGI
ncbi:hypothetical protein [Actinacidiphila paucisporea]|uniref:Uncharacterized protein n=1 Tax=Actinacidiphila paucisporea TaxID=310782 RepID=A0A1M7QSS4_9ACTN|nr:hypothetical protein [Actinacidiphila paucisporea]SHN34459.1 hypothetical protein SAMN05216499_14121 [Actinacidiphila paucisporea]